MEFLEALSTALFCSAVLLFFVGRAPQGLVLGSYLFVFTTHIHNLF